MKNYFRGSSMEKRLGNTALEHKYETGEKKKKRAL
jgi:hypothetical protein